MGKHNKNRTRNNSDPVTDPNSRLPQHVKELAMEHRVAHGTNNSNTNSETPQQGESSMSTETQQVAATLEKVQEKALETVVIAQEAQEQITKVEMSQEASSTKVSQGTTKTDKDVKKSALREVFIEAPKSVWNSTIVPAYEFVKGAALSAWESMKNIWKGEKEALDQLGFVKYSMDRVAKIAFKVIKLAAAVTIAMIIADLAEGYLSIDIFSMKVLGIALGLGVLFVMINSLLNQKEQGAEYSALRTGTDVIERFNAA